MNVQTQNATAAATMFLPQRVDGATWEAIEAAFPLKRVTGEDGAFQYDQHGDWYKLSVPAGWTIVSSPKSDWRRQVVDENGTTRLDLFLKPHGRGSVAIATADAPVLLPTRGDWAEIEAALPISRVVDASKPGEFVRGEQGIGYRVNVPAGWRVEDTTLSYWRKQLVDASGVERLTVFWKPLGGGSVHLPNDAMGKIAA